MENNTPDKEYFAVAIIESLGAEEKKLVKYYM